MSNDFFDYGVIAYKPRFSLTRSVTDYPVVTLDNCICFYLQFKFYTVSCDELIAEVQIVRRIDSTSTECLKFNLRDFTFHIIKKGDMSLCL